MVYELYHPLGAVGRYSGSRYHHLLSEGSHGEVGHCTALKEHVDHLRVADVVVTLVDALTIPSTCSILNRLTHTIGTSVKGLKG